MLAALGGLLSGVRSRQFVVEGALSIEARADGRLDGPPMLVQRWHQIRGPFAHTLHPCNPFRVVELALPRLQLPKPVPVPNTSATLAVISLWYSLARQDALLVLLLLLTAPAREELLLDDGSIDIRLLNLPVRLVYSNGVLFLVSRIVCCL